MAHLIVVSDKKDWRFPNSEVEVVVADDYLAKGEAWDRPRTKVINLCRSHRYQRTGYYVSLLAEARGHRPIPTVGTLQELRSPAVIKSVAADLDDLVQKALGPLTADTFELSVYFGRNMARRYDALAGALFRAFQLPAMRARFKRGGKRNRWTMQSIEAVDLGQVPDDHRATVEQALADHLAGRSPRLRRKARARYDLAILYDPADEEPASDPKAIERFRKAGEAVGFAVEVIGRDDYARLGEYDALFIRDTTAVNHYTFRFAQKAKADGLIVLDEPETIIKCLNKVYLAELLQKHRIPSPRSMIVTKRNLGKVEAALGLPCVLKQPDSAFSAGVTKAETSEELAAKLAELLSRSSLVIAQEFKPTDFDWRIGVLDGQPLYACRYLMATGHWQIIKHDKDAGTKLDGDVETIPVEAAPGAVLDLAVRAAGLYGDGLFGVDLKQVGSEVYVIEVNENPTIEAGYEDRVLGEELYLRIMRYFMSRVEQRKRAGAMR